MQEVATPIGMDPSNVWLASKWRGVDGNPEDNLVRAAAKRADARLLVTWNKEMLTKAIVPTLTPADAINVIDA